MDEKSNKSILEGGNAPPPVPVPDAKADDTSLFTPSEKEALAFVEKEGIRGIGATLANEMFNLFLEGYTCSDIAKLNAQLKLREGDVLYLRKRYRWDHYRDEYIYNLQTQMGPRLAKTKLEALETLMLHLAVAGKDFNPKAKRFLQTGKEEDKPDYWAGSPTAFKAIIETIAKITGEDRVQNHNIKSESRVVVESTQPVTIINPELQTKVLRKLALQEAKVDKKDKDE